MTSSAPSPPTTEAQRGSLLVIFLTVFIDLLGFGMVLPLLPLYAKQFGLEKHGWQIGMLMACFSLMQFIFAPLWGRLSDRLGRRPVLVVGLAGSVIFYGLFGVATMLQSLPLLFLTRIGAGIAGATISTAQAYIADTTTPQTRAKGMALIGASFGLGFTFGPLLAWAALLSSSGSDLDHQAVVCSPWPGFVASALSAVALLLAIFKLPESLRPGNSKTELGVFDRQALANALSTPTILPLLITSFISVVAFGGYETTIALLLEDKPSKGGFGLTIQQVPLFFAYIGLTLSLVQGGIVRRLSGKVSEMRLATIGGGLTMLGFALLAWSTTSHHFTGVMIASAIEVAGFSFMTPSLQSLISRRSDPQKQGSILGVSQGVSALARICGPLLAVPLFTIVSHTSPYYASIGLMVLGILMLLLAASGGRDYGTAAGEMTKPESRRPE